MKTNEVDMLLLELLDESQTVCLDQWWAGYEALTAAAMRSGRRSIFDPFLDQIDGRGSDHPRPGRLGMGRPDFFDLGDALNDLPPHIRHQTADVFKKYRRWGTQTKAGRRYLDHAHQHPGHHTCASDPNSPRVTVAFDHTRASQG